MLPATGRTLIYLDGVLNRLIRPKKNIDMTNLTQAAETAKNNSVPAVHTTLTEKTIEDLYSKYPHLFKGVSEKIVTEKLPDIEKQISDNLKRKERKEKLTVYEVSPFDAFKKAALTQIFYYDGKPRKRPDLPKLETSIIPKDEGCQIPIVLDYTTQKIMRERAQREGYAIHEFYRIAIWTFAETLVK